MFTGSAGAAFFVILAAVTVGCVLIGAVWAEARKVIFIIWICVIALLFLADQTLFTQGMAGMESTLGTPEKGKWDFFEVLNNFANDLNPDKDSPVMTYLLIGGGGILGLIVFGFIASFLFGAISKATGGIDLSDYPYASVTAAGMTYISKVVVRDNQMILGDIRVNLGQASPDEENPELLSFPNNVTVLLLQEKPPETEEQQAEMPQPSYPDDYSSEDYGQNYADIQNQFGDDAAQAGSYESASPQLAMPGSPDALYDSPEPVGDSSGYYPPQQPDGGQAPDYPDYPPQQPPAPGGIAGGPALDMPGQPMQPAPGYQYPAQQPTPTHSEQEASYYAQQQPPMDEATQQQMAAEELRRQQAAQMVSQDQAAEIERQRQALLALRQQAMAQQQAGDQATAQQQANVDRGETVIDPAFAKFLKKDKQE